MKERAVKGVLWAVLEKIGILVLKFLVGIVLARILMPSHFGIVGIAMVLFDIAGEIVQGGFGQAYIQKKNTKINDEATVFYFNLFVSGLIYIIFFFLAPIISKFYTQPLLINIIRVMSVVVIIDAVSLIKVAAAMKKVDLKAKTIVFLTAAFTSGVAAIIMAKYGMGIWALVFYIILNKFFVAIGFLFNTRILPVKYFSFSSLMDLFSYGSWLMFSSILKRIFENINILIIGKFFPVAQLGYYTKAKQFHRMASGQIIQAVSAVAFPMFSLIQKDREKLKAGIKKFLQESALVVFPITITLFVVAKPFVILLLTSKWIPMILFLKIFCFIGFLFPINSINIQVLVAQGYSKLNFNLTLIKNALRIINVIVMYRFGVLFIVAGEALISFISLFINTFYSKKILSYGIIKQIKDLKFHFLASLLSLLASLSFYLFLQNLYLMLFICTFISIGTFYLSLYIFNKKSLEVALEFKDKIFNKLKVGRED